MNKFLLHKSDAGEVKVDVLLKNETVWFTQKKIAELFSVQIPAISKHLKNIFETKNFQKTQLFPKWKQLQMMVKNIRQNFTIWMKC